MIWQASERRRLPEWVVLKKSRSPKSRRRAIVERVVFLSSKAQMANSLGFAFAAGLRLPSKEPFEAAEFGQQWPVSFDCSDTYKYCDFCIVPNQFHTMSPQM